MIKHTVKWQNYNGEDVEKDFWFNLDAGEIALLEFTEKGGFSAWMQTAIENDDTRVVGPSFEKILLSAVGRRDGDDFIKDDEAFRSFRWSGAYSALVLWMLQNPTEALTLINGMMPAAAQEALAKDELVAKMKAKTEEMAIPVTIPEEPVEPQNLPTMTTETPDFSAMTAEQFEEWKNNQG